MKEAMGGSDFNLMEKLFVVDLTWVAGKAPSDAVPREIAKRYRALSCRFHPDKHAADASYKVAFQALNEAHAAVKNSY